jgi:predicted porin
MASAAILGATGGIAMAQTAAPNQGQLSAPYGAGPAANNNNNNWGVANTPSGSAAAGPLSTLYAPNTDAVPAPGQIVIRLNGRIEADMTLSYTSADHVGATKVNPIGLASFARLYPAFDGMAANGLRYGASLEIRENFGSGTNNPGVLAGGTPAGTTAAPSASGYSSSQTLFVRRAFTYLANDAVGIVRIGQGDGVLGLFDPCIFTSGCYDAGMGNFNGGDIQVTSVQNPAGIPFVWLDQAGAEYANNKIVYLSPQFFGFDFGVQYAPNMGNSFANAGNGAGCSVAGPTCINQTSGVDATRWYNQVGVGLRYQGNFGAVDFKGYGFYETASQEHIAGGGINVGSVPASGRAALATTALKYDNLSFYKFGAAVTAMNFTLAADYIGGDIGSSGQLAMKPSGGVDMNAWLIGLTYANGPIAAGIEGGWVQGQGDARLVGISQRNEFEFAVGGNYKLAPGLQLVGEYMYSQRHQGDFNFNTNAIGSTGDARANSFLVGTVLSW